MTPLLYAARDGRMDTVRMLLDAGADINQRDANEITPLIIAITNNHPDVARFLIDRGADIKAVDWYGRTPLWAAVETRNMDVDNATFVNSIDRAPYLDLIQVLLERGADVNARMKEVPPIRRDFLRITGSLAWVDFTGQTPFLTAALAGDLTVMKLLLKHGADPHIPTFAGTTALMAAAGVNWVFDQTFDEGQPALLEAVKLCVELGLDVNAVNSMGLTAMHGAANRGSDDIIRYLVQQGAKIDVKDAEGRTPLTWAEGVFLATHPARPKPSSIELLKQLASSSRPPRNHDSSETNSVRSRSRWPPVAWAAALAMVWGGTEQLSAQRAPGRCGCCRASLPGSDVSDAGTASAATTSAPRLPAWRSTRSTSRASEPTPRPGKRSSRRSARA